LVSKRRTSGKEPYSSAKGHHISKNTQIKSTQIKNTQIKKYTNKGYPNKGYTNTRGSLS